MSSFEEELDKSGVLVFTNKGTSMMPLLRENRDLMVIEKKGPERCKKYDAVLFKRGDQYVLHRIVGVKRGELILSGDNQFEPESVKPEQVIARVEGFHRKGKDYSVTHMGYGLWVWLWVGLFPVRRPLIALRRRLGRIRRALKRK